MARGELAYSNLDILARGEGKEEEEEEEDGEKREEEEGRFGMLPTLIMRWPDGQLQMWQKFNKDKDLNLKIAMHRKDPFTGAF